MTSNPEVLFCDLCNESVPLADLDSGRAVRFKGRVVGACCVPGLRRGPERAERAAERRASGAASAVVGVVLVAAVAASAAFLDWRLSEEATGVAGRIAGLEDSYRRGQERLGAVEEALAQLGHRVDFAPLTARFDAIDSRVDQARASAEQQAARLDEALAALGEAHGKLLAEQREAIATVRESVFGLAADIAALRAAPVPSPRSAEEVATPPVVEEPAAAAPPAADELPAELKHHVLALGDEDPGTRYSAVDKLLRSRDLRVLPSLLPMAKDANTFVRRLTVMGLRDFRSPDSVQALLVALADPEPLVRVTANESLSKLTGQRFEFDDASAASRAAAQRRWQEWWDKNRATFSF